MKKITVFAAGILLMAFGAAAQCSTKTTWTTSKTEFVNPSGDVQSKPGGVTVITSKDSISVATANGDEEMKGSITGYSCNWKDSTNGNMSFKSELMDKQGKLRHATVTIEAKDGKTIILLEATEEATKIRLPVESYVMTK